METETEREREKGLEKMAMNKQLPTITLNVSGLNAPNKKRYRVAEWVRKHNSHICCLQKTHLRTKDLHRLKVNGEKKKIFEANRHEKKAGLVILISDKRVFKTKDIKSDKEGQYIILKGLVQQEDINP